MRLQLAVLPVPRHLQSVFSPAAFPKAAAKPSATDRPAYCRDSRRSNCQLFRSWWKLPAWKPARGLELKGAFSGCEPMLNRACSTSAEVDGLQDATSENGVESAKVSQREPHRGGVEPGEYQSTICLGFSPCHALPSKPIE